MELTIEEKKDLKKTDFGYVPDEWKVYKFGDLILDMKGGASLSKRNYTDHGIKVIPKGGVGRGGLLNVDKEDQNYCSYEYYKKHLNNAVDKKYTIIVLRDLVPSGPNIGLMVNIESDETYILAQGVYGFRVNPELTIPEYLVHLSNSNQYRKLMQSILVGSTQVHVRNTTLTNVEIPLPPTLEEQQAIASALSDVDELIRSLDRLIQKKEAIKKGTMQQLLTGKKRLPGFDEEWAVVKSGEVVEYINGRAYSKHEWEDTGIPVVRLQNLTGSGERYYYSNLNLPEKNYMYEGDLIFMWSASFGPYIWKGPKAIYHYHIWKIDCNEDKIDKMFYYHKLVRLTEELKQTTSGSTMLHLTKAGMEKFKLNLPSLEEQKAIAQILSDMDRELQTLRQKREKYKQIKQGIMQELLTGKTRLV
ncbi:MAG: hypothetical protein GVY20_16855 [Bacteroidetes bacterium]|jgi:type I restriction enzyme S subunit|nr:hypothetical protein [Bacteroidota bacterium]